MEHLIDIFTGVGLAGVILFVVIVAVMINVLRRRQRLGHGAGKGGVGTHGEARRLAQLLVAELELYHESGLAKALLERRVLAHLGDDLARTRALYEARVAPEVLATSDYLREEIVRQLADGDPAALGD